jgi:membrane fusion protein, multidrug efflux system
MWARYLVLVMVLLVAGFTIWRVHTGRQQAAASAAAKQAAILNRPTPVQVTAVRQQTMPIYLTALGNVTPYNTVTLKARVSGELTQVNFTEGQEVKQGQTLLVIDPRPYQAALDQAKGQLAHDQALLTNATSEYARYQALFKAGVISKEQLDLQQSTYGQYEGAIKSDEAAIETAALNVKYCTITSPIDGRIGLRLVDRGNLIAANTTNLVIINQIHPIAVDFTLPEDQLPQVFPKLAASQRLVVEAFDRSDVQKLATGYLLTADNQIDPTTGTAKLKAVFQNEGEILFPNQFVNVHLIVEQKPDAIIVPAVALQHGTQGDFVWLLKDDKTVQMQPVRVQLTEGSRTILMSGLSEGQMVVVDGADRLRSGSKVDPRQAQAKTAQASGAPGTQTPPDASAPATDKNGRLGAPAEKKTRQQ